MISLMDRYIWKLLDKVYKKIDAVANESAQTVSEFDVIRKFKDFMLRIEDENNTWLSIHP